MSSSASEVGFRDYLSHNYILGVPDGLQFKVLDMVIFM